VIVLTPRLLIITALDVVPEAALMDRIRAAAALPPDIRSRVAVQLRDPELTGRALFEFGARLRAATRAAEIALVVNDRLDLARSLAAEGVHLGRRSVSVADARSFLGQDIWVSVSCHAPSEVPRAAQAGADAALLSPIFASPGKGPPLGVEALRDASGSLPIIALGGVDAGALPACFQAGAAGVAAIRADLAQTLVSTLRTYLAT
jgi:thiamine-phosphate pyrophosphorylase